jgi:hypothetical protein
MVDGSSALASQTRGPSREREKQARLVGWFEADEKETKIERDAETDVKRITTQRANIPRTDERRFLFFARLVRVDKDRHRHKTKRIQRMGGGGLQSGLRSDCNQRSLRPVSRHQSVHQQNNRPQTHNPTKSILPCIKPCDPPRLFVCAFLAKRQDCFWSALHRILQQSGAIVLLPARGDAHTPERKRPFGPARVFLLQTAAYVFSLPVSRFLLGCLRVCVRLSVLFATLAAPPLYFYPSPVVNAHANSL